MSVKNNYSLIFFLFIILSKLKNRTYSLTKAIL